MKYYELDKEEQALLEAVEKGLAAFPKTPTAELEKYRAYARHTSSRTRNINIRLSERDLLKLKAKALEKGIPYQTLVASILHQYNNQS
jgi:predicted DNA binding CopG/RHH family protein